MYGMGRPEFVATLSGEITLGFTILSKKVFLLLLREMANVLKLFYIYSFNRIYVFILKL